MSGPYTYARPDTAEYKRIGFHGISEGEKFANDLRPARATDNKGPCEGLGQRKWCGWRPFIQWPFQGLAGNTRLIGAEQTTR